MDGCMEGWTVGEQGSEGGRDVGGNICAALSGWSG